MNTKSIGSLFVLLAVASMVFAVPGIAFADHGKATVENAQGSSTPGCEETNECFIPATVTIDEGGEVTFVNSDNAAHTSTSGTPADGPDGVWDSSLVMVGASYSVTLDTAGTYDYFCMVHPWMVGTVIVQAEMAEEEHDDHGDDHGDSMDMSSPSVVDIQISVPSSASAGDRVPIDIKFVDGMGMGTEHVNYDIKVTHGGETLIDETGVHDHHGEGSHTTPALTSDASDDDPIDVLVTFQGFGFPNDMKTGPIGTTSNAQVVPEFGTIAAMILAVAIVSIIAVTAKSRLSITPRL